ncbi:MAG: hypothetical protein HY308_11900 [Gammaproteobacteria bacterium]|nr:hypothetical protein [Gammaproteobacteria bacterium]
MKNFLLAVVLMVAGCVGAGQSADQKTVVLNYEDFGPQAMAYELLGMEWWQWLPHGDSRPTTYDIKVVVYRNGTLDDVKHQYPTVAEKEQDYRYLAYPEALQYLDKNIKENVLQPVTDKLKLTREKIVGALGNP